MGRVGEDGVFLDVNPDLDKILRLFIVAFFRVKDRMIVIVKFLVVEERNLLNIV